MSGRDTWIGAAPYRRGRRSRDESGVFVFDLDDTLMHTQEDYDAARHALAEWVHDRMAGEGVDVPINTVRDWHRSVSEALLDEYGLTRERFPAACRQTYEELARVTGVDPDPYAAAVAEEIGQGVFGDADYYAAHGLVDGAEDVLNGLRERGETLILLTKGDPEVQRPKLEGLDLDRWFEEVRVVGEKREALEDIAARYDDRVVHVGNSPTSDVKAALDAGVEPVHVPGGTWDALEDDVDLPRHRVTGIEHLEDLLQVYGSLRSGQSPP